MLRLSSLAESRRAPVSVQRTNEVQHQSVSVFSKPLCRLVVVSLDERGLANLINKKKYVQHYGNNKENNPTTKRELTCAGSILSRTFSNTGVFSAVCSVATKLKLHVLHNKQKTKKQ
jgi:hypothetical protein